MLKRNLVLMMLAVLFVVAGANAALDPGINLFATGDMESGGDEWTPPLNWSSNGTDPGQGIIGVSTDTPTGAGQSLCVSGYVVEGYDYNTYSHDYADQSGYAEGTELSISYDVKGDFYTTLGTQNGPDVIVDHGYGAEQLHYGWPPYSDDNTVWYHYEETFTVGVGGVDGFSFYLYDATPEGEAAYLDNLVVMVIGSELLMGAPIVTVRSLLATTHPYRPTSVT